MRAEITTVGELVAALAAYPPQTPGAAGRGTRLPASRHDRRHRLQPRRRRRADGTDAHPTPTRNGWCGSAKAPSSATCPRSPATPSATAGPEHHSTERSQRAIAAPDAAGRAEPGHAARTRPTR